MVVDRASVAPPGACVQVLESRFGAAFEWILPLAGIILLQVVVPPRTQRHSRTGPGVRVELRLRVASSETAPADDSPGGGYLASFEYFGGRALPPPSNRGWSRDTNPAPTVASAKLPASIASGNS